MGVLKKLKESKNKVRDVIAYLQGSFRYKVFYSNFKFLIRRHIREQIEFRILVMDKDCYDNGSCKLCGCTTTALQMANKRCDKPCYPKMYSKVQWRAVKSIYKYAWENDKRFYYKLVNDLEYVG